ncbi:MAG: YbaK/EbsC family protein [Meiothermus sp.]|nr:YbaK/EbsC family protein [Meiothermus sp.]
MPLSPSSQRVRDVLTERGFGHLEVLELSQSTRTAQEAAEAVGCALGQIVKSLIFRGASSGRPYLLLVSGSNRVDVHGVELQLGERLEKPNADYVREVTGFAIGGVPPVGHVTALEALLDPDLMGYAQVYAAAGTPLSLFGLTPQELQILTGGRIMAMG